MMPAPDHAVRVFLTASALSLALTGLMVPFARWVGLVDKPGEHKAHKGAVPLGGGVAMFLSFLTVLLVPGFRTPTAVVIVAAGGVLMIVGFLDDLIGVSAILKFLILIGLTLVLTRFGIMAETTRIYPIDLVLTLLWVTGVSSAFNAIDNMDGLATGVTLIAATTFFVVARQTNQSVFGGVSAALAGAAFGFLILNFPPARIFMGDAGSLFLGFALAVLGLTGDWSENEAVAAVIPVLILGFPIFDLSFTVLTRHIRGTTRTLAAAIRHCDTDHVSHRLRALGLSPLRALLFMYFISISFAISAVTLRHALSVDAFLHLAQAICITLSLVFILLLTKNRARTEPGPAGTHAGAPPAARSALLALLATVLGLLYWMAG